MDLLICILINTGSPVSSITVLLSNFCSHFCPVSSFFHDSPDQVFIYEDPKQDGKKPSISKKYSGLGVKSCPAFSPQEGGQ